MSERTARQFSIGLAFAAAAGAWVVLLLLIDFIAEVIRNAT